MHALSVLLLAFSGRFVSQSQVVEKNDDNCEFPVVSKGPALIQKQHRHVSSPALLPHQLSMAPKATPRMPGRSFIGGSASVVGAELCTTDTYNRSPLESQWISNVLNWTGEDHCSYLTLRDANSWIQDNKDGTFDPAVFSTLCRKGQLPQYIEPLAGVLRDPRFGCDEIKLVFPEANYLNSVDWLVFPDAPAPASGSKSRFYDAGGTHFGDAMLFFLETYRGHGIVFDEVYVWEFHKQGTERYWARVDNETRAFWEPRLFFYDGVPVTAEVGAEHNPVSRIFQSCGPDDFCAFKLDIDNPEVEHPLIEQLFSSPEETALKLDELFFEHHVQGVMSPWWGIVNGTFEDSYNLFEGLRKLGVRAHSWI